LVVFVLLTVIGIGYVGLFAFFLRNSVNYITARQTVLAQRLLLPADTTISTSLMPGKGLLLAGWQPPEAWGVWSGNSTTALFVPACIGNEPVRAVKLSIGAISPPLQSYGFHFEWHRQAGTSPIDSGPASAREFRVPTPVVRCGSVQAADGMQLDIRTATPLSPKELGSGNDGRKLGYALNSIEFDVHQ
jgi:hypothetical protein